MPNDEITHIPFTGLQEGDTASESTKLTEDKIKQFAECSGDYNPLHLDEAFAADTIFKHRIGHGMWTASLISKVIGIQLPGAGTIYLHQDLDFKAPVYIDDTITTTVTISSLNAENHHVTLDCVCKNQKDKIVLTGTAIVIAK